MWFGTNKLNLYRLEYSNEKISKISQVKDNWQSPSFNNLQSQAGKEKKDDKVPDITD